MSGLSDVRVCDTCGDASDAAGDVAAGDGGCACAPPDGWQLVGVAGGDAGAGASCPAGFDRRDLVTADVSSVACPCSCAVTTPPSCTTGNVVYAYGANALCSTMGQPFSASGCYKSSPFSVAAYQEVVPVAPTGGACSTNAAPTGDAGAVALHACAPQAGQCGLCAGVSGLGTCVWRSGAAACPMGYPVATSAGASVSGATCTCPACQLQPSCTNARLRFYADDLCTQEAISAPATGACLHLAVSGQTVASMQYTATASATCAAEAGAPAATYSGGVTVCCRK